MIKTDYLNYTYRELLEDEFFITSHLYPTEESIAFWEELANEDKVFAHQLETAIQLLKAVPFRNAQLAEDSKDILFSRIKETIKIKNRRRNVILYISSAIAACIAILFVLNYLSKPSHDILLTGIESVGKPTLPVTDIQLIDNDNNEMIIDGDDPVITHDQHGSLTINSQKVEKDSEKAVKQEVTYNQLIVPHGKKTFLTLSDGTSIWVNANSRIVYPNVFGDNREILVEGEAFLDVAPDNNKPFYVKTRDMQIRVYGTSFNVSAFEEDTEASVVLVTGKVTVDTRNKQHQILLPNQMLSYGNREITTRTVDVNNYISWRKGTYTYNSEEFTVVLKRLSRYYGKEIIWSKAVENLMRCSGSLNLKDDIFDLLEKLEKAVPVTFHQNGEIIEVTVNPQK